MFNVLFWIIIYFNLGFIASRWIVRQSYKDSEKIAQSWEISESTPPFLGVGEGLVLSSFHGIIIVRISECFANCLIFSLKVFYFSYTIHFISEGSANMWIWWNGSKEVSYCAWGYFHDTGMTFILEWVLSILFFVYKILNNISFLYK